MLNKIINYSLRNRIFVMAAAVLLVIAGAYTTKNMEVDVFPDLNAPTVTVLTEAAGLAPEEVEKIVTFPLETALNRSYGRAPRALVVHYRIFRGVGGVRLGDGHIQGPADSF